MYAPPLLSRSLSPAPTCADLRPERHLRAVRAAAGGVGAERLQRHRLRLRPDGLGKNIHHGQELDIKSNLTSKGRREAGRELGREQRGLFTRVCV